MSQLGDGSSLHDLGQRTVSGGPDQLSDGRSSSAFQRGQLDFQVRCSTDHSITRLLPHPLKPSALHLNCLKI